MDDRPSENLFRQKAIDSLATKADGRPIAVMPKSWLWLAGFTIAFALAAGLYLWSAQYSRKETVRGWLVADQGIVRVSHNNFATVARVSREAGDTVKRGDPIVSLSSDAILSDGTDSSRQLLVQLHEQLLAADRREKLAREKFVTDHRALELQVASIDEEIEVLRGQEYEQTLRVARNTRKHEQLQTAHESGAVAKLDLMQQQDELTSMQQLVARLRQERIRLEREQQARVAAQEQLGIELERQLAELVSERGELQQRMTQYEKLRLLVLQSPVEGTIATLDVVPGNTVRPQQLLATVVPVDSTLLANVFVPSRAIGMVRPGQEVRLLYDAFPHQQFGTARGQVRAVAGYVSLPGDMPAASGLREAAYKVTISIDADHVTDARGRYALRPGMSLAAEIILESRSLAHWLLAPIKARL